MLLSATVRTLVRRCSATAPRLPSGASLFRSASSSSSKSENSTPKENESVLTDEEYFAFRQKQLSSVQNWYPNKLGATRALSDVARDFAAALAPEQTASESVTVAGRIGAIRRAGKSLHFVDIFGGHDNQHRLQIKIHQKSVSDSPSSSSDESSSPLALASLLRRGDVIGVVGVPCRTKAGELSLLASRVQLLAPCLRKMPSPHVDLENVNKRLRRRYYDFLAGPHRIDIFRKRARIIAAVRAFLDKRGFLEVETPVLNLRYGGASAKPFRTHFNAADSDVFLRISPELHLKQLVVGGLERVYEIGKTFRNEEMSPRHNPEFSMCEFYMAYADYNVLMQMTEQLLREVAAAAKAPGEVCKVNGEEIDFEESFPRLDFLSSIEEASGRRLPSAEDLNADDQECRDFLVALCKETKVSHESVAAQVLSSGKLVDRLFDHLVSPSLVRPTFVVDLPQCLCPLAKPHGARPGLTERFELYAGGVELVNAYTELNDPRLQRKLFEQQTRAGDLDSGVDEEFLRALEYGLPPTAGWGMGLDRFVMLLTNQNNIKEVLLFPMMRPIKDRHRVEDENNVKL